MTSVNHCFDSCEPPGHIAVKIELVSLVDSETRISMPKHNTIVTTEFFNTVRKHGINQVLVSGSVIKINAVHHAHPASKIAAHPP